MLSAAKPHSQDVCFECEWLQSVFLICILVLGVNVSVNAVIGSCSFIKPEQD